MPKSVKSVNSVVKKSALLNDLPPYEPKIHHAIEEIMAALDGFAHEEQARLLRAACVLCQLDADINPSNPTD